MSNYNCHAGDCTIYASLSNGFGTDGICTCGYGWQQVMRGDYDCMFSEERKVHIDEIGALRRLLAGSQAQVAELKDQHIKFQSMHKIDGDLIDELKARNEVMQEVADSGSNTPTNSTPS